MYYAFQDRENLYLVMDYLSGGDLRYHICRHRRFTEEVTRKAIAIGLNLFRFLCSVPGLWAWVLPWEEYYTQRHQARESSSRGGRLPAHNWFRHRSRLAWGECVGHLGHSWVHGTGSDVQAKPHYFCGLLRCRSNGIRVHVWKSNYSLLLNASCRGRTLASQERKSETTYYLSRSRSNAKISRGDGQLRLQTSLTK